MNAGDESGHTPLFYAKRHGHGEMVSFLLSAGAADETETVDNTIRCKTVERNLEEGGAVVWYLNHSGWAVKTKNHFLMLMKYFLIMKKRKLDLIVKE